WTHAPDFGRTIVFRFGTSRRHRYAHAPGNDRMALAKRGASPADTNGRGATQFTPSPVEFARATHARRWTISCYSRLRMRAWMVGMGMAAALAVAPGAAGAASYAVRARWSPSSDAGVAGYRVYMRPAGGVLTFALD